MRFVVGLLGGALAVALVGAGIELGHPHGVKGFLDGLTGPGKGGGTKTSSAPKPATAPGAAQGTAPATGMWGPGAAKALEAADESWDHGDFDVAVTQYMGARSLASGPEERDRAVRGLQRALLAWALVRAAPHVALKPSDAESQWAVKVSAAETAPSERTWADAARFAAGADLRERLPYAVGQALDAARPGGFVQATLEDTLAVAGGRRSDLLAAMRERGLAGPAGGSTTATASGGATKGTTGWKPPQGDDSGIGGVNTRGVPFGAFSADTRRQLRTAIDLQAKGATAYRAAAPDSPNRAENRDRAPAAQAGARRLPGGAEGGRHLPRPRRAPEGSDADDRPAPEGRGHRWTMSAGR